MLGLNRCLPDNVRVSGRIGRPARAPRTEEVAMALVVRSIQAATLVAGLATREPARLVVLLDASASFAAQREAAATAVLQACPATGRLVFGLAEPRHVQRFRLALGAALGDRLTIMPAAGADPQKVGRQIAEALGR